MYSFIDFLLFELDWQIIIFYHAPLRRLHNFHFPKLYQMCISSFKTPDAAVAYAYASN